MKKLCGSCKGTGRDKDNNICGCNKGQELFYAEVKAAQDRVAFWRRWFNGPED